MTSQRPSVGVPPTCLAPHALAARAAQSPDAAAVIYVGGATVTNAELHHGAQALARQLASIGVGRGTHVATFIPNGPFAHLAFLALGWLTAAEVPLNAALTGPLLRHALDEAHVEVLLVSSQFVDRLSDLDLPSDLRAVVQIDGEPAPGTIPLASLAETDVELPGPIYRDIAAIMFTSGTTGPSKGVVFPWAVVYQFWSWLPDDGMGPTDRLYCALTMSHNSGRSAFNYAMVRGATVVARERFSGNEFWADVREHGCTIAALVGPMTQLLHSAPLDPADADNPLRTIITGPLIPEVEEFKRRFGVRIATSYGMTETGIVLSTGWDHGPAGNCGRPRPDYPWPEVRIVDEFDEPVAPGSVGELVVRTAEPWAMNVGYHGRPEATADAWRNGWFHTGDAFRVDDDGWYHLVDRLKDTIRRRGENISSFELEAIAGGHPDVIEAAAIGVPARLGEHDVLLVLEVADPASFDHNAYLAWVTPQVPRFMVPRYVEAVAALPRNATTQRVKKHDLRARGITSTARDFES